ncbi:MAG: CDP-diacylglycerol--glycerol-3-phosphate 3-phosphatidyltransferase [Candidatus Omnitrophica bacterium]|nr:CDP-diacylglycerol--glycerol-3-phosphate 3-phosphatidyltransferase [Candidatus Omnitrophota bacterium]MDE2009788.1 CDP-diacylglycerol--glycerol-3-phosphate 3-phosphatidyltransferase [Candidatus Omnitrophota bacterium]MDE2215133.1 CDP-diacylglycerol--glycerol-3-phosphate 3-phosphatidyltransferase [Candidatus Omnitrophota bacterium]MDE2231487.1 CDP-diacylglycerol--glycerol-3-phosphate 3-phosphatidyltransferase [Candidatus Omnitrophota bacterium]
MNLPNILTLSRFVLAAVMAFLLMERSLAGNTLAVIVFAAASLTDFYDGHLAKTRGLTSDFGKIMDPIADKALLLSAFGVLAHLGLVRWWMFLVIAVREIGVTISRLMACARGQVLPAERAGKVKTVSQMVAVSSILLYLVAGAAGGGWFYHVRGVWSDVNYGLMLAAVVLTVYSGIDYFRHKKI